LDYFLQLEFNYPPVDPDETDEYPKRFRTLIDSLKYLKEKKKTLSINFLHKSIRDNQIEVHKRELEKLYKRDFPNRKPSRDPSVELLHWIAPLKRRKMEDGSYELSWKGGAQIADCWSATQKKQIDPEYQKYVNERTSPNRQLHSRSDAAPALLTVLVMDPFFTKKGGRYVLCINASLVTIH